MSIVEINRPKLINEIYPGVVSGSNNLISVNSKFFAYSTIISVYIYSQKPSIRPVNIISSDSTISTISLAQKTQNLIAISTNNYTVKIIHIENNELISSFTNDINIVSIGWQNNDKELICFTHCYNHYYIFDAYSGQKLFEQKGDFGNLRVLAISRKTNPPIMIGGNRCGTITKICGNQAKSYEFQNRGPILSVCLDPFCDDNCLIVWKTCWRLYTIGDALIKTNAQPSDDQKISNRSPRRFKRMGVKHIDGILLINECENFSFNFSSACWSTVEIGQFLTSDYLNGNIRIWQASSPHFSEIIKVHQTGISEIHAMQSNRLLIAFNDGMIAVYDLTNRCFLLKNISGHLNSIFSIQIFPNNTNSIVTSSGEGQICFWTMDELLQQKNFLIHIDDTIGHMVSMKVSPGGGYILCGHSRGYLSIYSFESQKVVSLEKVGQHGVSHIEFNSKMPELVLLSLLGENFVLFNMSTSKIEYKLPNGYFGYYAKFLNETEIIACGKNFLTITDQNKIDKLEHKDKSRELFAIDFTSKNVVVSIDNSGDVILWNLKDKTYSIVYSESDKLRSINFLFDNLVFVGGYKGIITVIDVSSQKIVMQFQGHSRHIYSIALNNFVLITGSSESSIKFWSIDNLFKKNILNALVNFGLTNFNDQIDLSNNNQITNNSSNLTEQKNNQFYLNNGQNELTNYTSNQTQNDQKSQLLFSNGESEFNNNQSEFTNSQSQLNSSKKDQINKHNIGQILKKGDELMNVKFKKDEMYYLDYGEYKNGDIYEIQLNSIFSNQLNSINKFLKLINRCTRKNKLAFDFENDMIHINDITQLSKSFQKQNNSKKEIQIIKRAIKSKEKIIQNARIELFQGNPKKYCELMFSIGEYDQAISIAPIVSIEFWKNLIKKKIEFIENKKQICDYHITIGEIDNAIDDLIEIDDYKMAFLLASSDKPNNKIIHVRGRNRNRMQTKIDFTINSQDQNNQDNELNDQNKIRAIYQSNHQIQIQPINQLNDQIKSEIQPNSQSNDQNKDEINIQNELTDQNNLQDQNIQQNDNEIDLQTNDPLDNIIKISEQMVDPNFLNDGEFDDNYSLENSYEVSYEGDLSYEGQIDDSNSMEISMSNQIQSNINSSQKVLIDKQFNSSDKFFEYQIASQNSMKCLNEGQIYLAAASYLTIGDIIQCERLLYIHGQLPLAFFIDQQLNVNDEIIKEKFAMLCISNKIFSIFKILSKSEKEQVVISIEFSSIEDRETFYKEIEIEPISFYLYQLNTITDPYKKLHLLLLANQLNDAIQFYLEYSQNSTDFVILRDMTKLIEKADLASVDNVEYYSVVFYSMYFAFYESIYRNYKIIQSTFLGKMNAICKKYLNNDFIFTKKLDECNFLYNLGKNSKEESKITTIACNSLNEKPLGTPYLSITMYGNIFTLDDGKTQISMEEALMWFNLCPFSPLLTRVKTYLY